MLCKNVLMPKEFEGPHGYIILEKGILNFKLRKMKVCLFEQNCSDPIAQIMTQLQRGDGDGANEEVRTGLMRRTGQTRCKLRRTKEN